MSDHVLTISYLDQIKIAFGLDWIRSRHPPRWMHASEPDLVENQREFFAHEIEWAVGGQRYAYAIPVHTKQREIWTPLRGTHMASYYDDLAMLDDLVGAIRSTCARERS